MLEKFFKKRKEEESKLKISDSFNVEEISRLKMSSSFNKTENPSRLKISNSLKKDKANEKSMFYVPTDFDEKHNEKNINEFENPDEFLEYLANRNSLENSESKNKKYISEYLELKKKSNYSYMYTEDGKDTIENINPRVIEMEYSQDPNVESFFISGNEIERTNYRITFRHSPNKKLNQDELVAFLRAFSNEANIRNLDISCKIRNEGDKDALILYTNKECLLDTVKILEDLKDENKYGNLVSSATKHFGRVQPFSATVNDDAYYGIAMHGREFGKEVKTKYHDGLEKTFNMHMDECLDYAYSELLKKYNGNKELINENEMYNLIVNYHKHKMDINDNLPLWMNNRIYNDLHEKSIKLKY